MRRKRIVQIIVVLCNIQFALAQSIEPQGAFLQTESKIGEELQFCLSVKYDRNLNILFPDSLYQFGPFEYSRREYFTTKTDSAFSYDSAVYHLSTFEIDSMQYLQLPVFVVNNDDSLAIFSNIDSVALIQVVAEIPENVEMKANTELVKIKRQFNYPYLLLALGILTLICLIVLLFFGKQIYRAWKVFLLRRAHKKFIGSFFSLMRDVSGGNPVNTAEHVLAVWKGYLEKLEKKPISKLTTKEILVLHNNSELKSNLRTIDRSVYGGEKGNDLFACFDYLMQYSIEIYNEKIKEIKND